MFKSVVNSPLINSSVVGDDKAKAATPAAQPDRFTSWGNEGGDAKKEGWYPAQWSGEQTVYRNSYNPAMNTVVIPGDKSYGHVAAIGYKNGLFDLVIRDGDGNTKQVIKKGVSPQVIRQYFTDKQSPIQQRVNSIQAGTNADRQNSSGGFALLYNPNNVK